jgi:hypothetical protein
MCKFASHGLALSCGADTRITTRFKASNRPSSSFSKRGRALSTSGAPPNAPKRLRAHDLEGVVDPAVGELFKGPCNWVNLRKALASGAWLTRRQQAGVVQHHSPMGLEDISTHIHEIGMYVPHSSKGGADYFFYAERGFEEPSIPFVTSNSYYNMDLGDQVQLVYEQWPCYVTSINAEGIPTPPRPSQHSESNPLPVVYSSPSSAESRHSPNGCSIQVPWSPLRHAIPTPVVQADPTQVRAFNSGGYIFWPPEVRRLTGVGSAIQRLHDEMVPFVQSMTRAHMFNPYSPVEVLAPDFFLRDVVSHTDSSIASRFLGAAYKTPEELLFQVEILNDRLITARAMYEFALLEALDACAVLGGVELPIWPPNPSYTGCWIPPSRRASAEVNESYFLQARARKLERWGVPLWCEVPRRLNRRYEAGPIGGPVAAYPMLELRHQRRLSALTLGNPPVPLKKVCIAAGNRSASHPFHPSSSPLPQGHEIRRSIEHAISALVDPESPEAKTFDVFNKEMMRLLGTGVWSGKKHEFQHHHGHILPGSKERPRWLKVRDGVHDCGHKGALLAAVEIPNVWYEPCSCPLDFRGVDIGSEALCRPLELPQPGVPIMDWYVVEVAGLEKSDEAQGESMFDAYRSRGALGYRWVLCKTQNKDENGRSIRHSRYQVELLFKSAQAHRDAASSIRQDFPELLVNESSCIGMDMAWINLFDLPIDWVYVAALFNRPLPASRRQELLALAPPSSVPPTRSDGVSPGERADAERSHLGKLCHRELFEYDTKHPPTVQPTASTVASTSTSASTYASASASASTATFASVFTSSSSFTSASLSSSAVRVSASACHPIRSDHSVAQGRHALHMSQLSLERFTHLAFAPVPPDCRLSDDQVIRFQRLALVLQACKRCAPFSSRVFPSNGAPYRAILHYVASVVKQSSGHHGYAFHSGEHRHKIGPWVEMLKMKPDGMVEVFVDPDASLDSCPIPSQDEVDKYYDACNREHRKTRSEKRRKRQRGGNNTPEALPAD